MKNAKVTIVAIDLTCPYCDETLAAPDGQFYWTDGDLPKSNIIKCFHCAKDVKVSPKTVAMFAN